MENRVIALYFCLLATFGNSQVLPVGTSVTCKNNGVTYADGATWKDESICKEWKCEGGTVVGGLYGCRDVTEQKCRLKGEEWDVGSCLKKGCEVDDAGTTAGEYMASEGCYTGSECLDIGETFSPRPCFVYKCTKTENLYEMETESEGCHRNDVCHEVDSEWEEGEYTLACEKNATHYFVTIEDGPETGSSQGCSYEDETKDVGEEWTDDCYTMTCVIEDGYYSTKVIATACKGADKCYNDGESWADETNTHTCSCNTTHCTIYSAYLPAVASGCVDGDVTRDIGDEWTDDRCYKKKCDSTGNIIVIAAACKVNNGGKEECVENGWTTTVDCVTWECKVASDFKSTSYQPTVIKCKHKSDGGVRCLDNGVSVKTGRCTSATCEVDMENKSWKFTPNPACSYKGECVPVGERRTNDLCKSLVCKYSEKQGGFTMMDPTNEGCAITKRYYRYPADDTNNEKCALSGEQFIDKNCKLFECRENNWKIKPVGGKRIGKYYVAPSRITDHQLGIIPKNCQNTRCPMKKGFTLRSASDELKEGRCAAEDVELVKKCVLYKCKNGRAKKVKPRVKVC